MNKEKMLDFAIDLLKRVELDEVEDISFSGNVFDDDAPYLEVTVNYKGGEKD